jgi:short-subunit dehydrogenase
VIELRDKVVVVTGASSGIGLETAKAFAREGCKLALGARRPDRLEAARLAVEACGGEALALAGDVRDEAYARALVEAARRRWGRVDVLVNNAGYGLFKPFPEMTTEEFRGQFETNMYGAVYATKAALEDMLPRGSGHIINVASILAKVASPNYTAYNASKAALDSFSEALRAELASRGVSVTAVHPGPTDTAFFEKGGAGSVKRSSLPIVQRPEDVAEAIVRAARAPRAEVYPRRALRVVPVLRAVFPPVVRLALRGAARIYR